MTPGNGWSKQEQADAARGHAITAQMVTALTAATAPAPGSAQWWAALADDAAQAAQIARDQGDAAEARKWQGVAADASVRLGKAVRP